MEIQCKRCNGTEGITELGGVHVKLVCKQCGAYQRFLSKADAGLERRSLQTTHEAIKPKMRAHVIMRATARCELCGKTGCQLTVGHLLSVKDGHSQGLEDDIINGAENLAAMCEECNVGMSSESVPLRLAAALLRSRLTRNGTDDSR